MLLGYIRLFGVITARNQEEFDQSFLFGKGGIPSSKYTWLEAKKNSPEKLEKKEHIEMVKCLVCEHHRFNGKHTCPYCKTKEVYGELAEPLISCCGNYKPTEEEKKRIAERKEWWKK